MTALSFPYPSCFDSGRPLITPPCPPGLCLPLLPFPSQLPSLSILSLPLSFSLRSFSGCTEGCISFDGSFSPVSSTPFSYPNLCACRVYHYCAPAFGHSSSLGHAGRRAFRLRISVLDHAFRSRLQSSRRGFASPRHTPPLHTRPCLFAISTQVHRRLLRPSRRLISPSARPETPSRLAHRTAFFVPLCGKRTEGRKSVLFLFSPPRRYPSTQLVRCGKVSQLT